MCIDAMLPNAPFTPLRITSLQAYAVLIATSPSTYGTASYHRHSSHLTYSMDHALIRNFPLMPRYMATLITIGHLWPHLEFMLWYTRSRALDFRGACMQSMVGTLDLPLNRITAIEYGFGKHAWNAFVIHLSGSLPKLISQLSATLITLLCRTFFEYYATRYLISHCHPLTPHMYRPLSTPPICLHELFLPIAHL